MYTNGPQIRSCIIIVGKNGTAITIASKRLGREKRSSSCITKRTGTPPLIQSTKALCTIFKYKHSMPMCNIVDYISIIWQTKQINRYYSLRI